MECGSFSLSLGRKEREKNLFLSGVSASVRSLLLFPLPLEKSLRILSVIGLSITNTYIMHHNAISYIIMQYHREIIRLNHHSTKTRRVLLQFVDFWTCLHPNSPSHFNCLLKQNKSAELAAFIAYPEMAVSVANWGVNAREGDILEAEIHSRPSSDSHFSFFGHKNHEGLWWKRVRMKLFEEEEGLCGPLELDEEVLLCWDLHFVRERVLA